MGLQGATRIGQGGAGKVSEDTMIAVVILVDEPVCVCLCVCVAGSGGHRRA
jgi:hypothetical protein